MEPLPNSSYIAVCHAKPHNIIATTMSELLSGSDQVTLAPRTHAHMIVQGTELSSAYYSNGAMQVSTEILQYGYLPHLYHQCNKHFKT